MASPQIYSPLIKIALPIIFIQVCQASLGLFDTLIAGRYHFQHLAAVGLGSNLWTPVITLATGVLYALIPKISSCASQRDFAQMQTLYQHGKHNAIKLMAFGFITIHLLAFFCPYFIADPEVAMITRRYLHFVAFAVPGLMYMVLNRFFCEGNSRFAPVVITTVIISVLNVSLNVVLVNGLYGLPKFGGAGCGLATAISVTLGAGVIHYLSRRQLRFAFPASGLQVDKRETKTMFKEGLPIGIAIVVEIIALSLLAFFASNLGTKVIAAHQVAINIAIVVFMIPLALGAAATIRIAHFRAKKQNHNVVRTRNASLLLTLVYGALMAGAILMLLPPFTTLFSHDVQVVTMISTLLVYIAVFQFVDALLIVASSILRGVEEFIKPLLAIFCAYWLFILPFSYVIGVKGWWVNSPGIETIWALLIVGISVAASLLILQARQHTHALPDINSPQQALKNG